MFNFAQDTIGIIGGADGPTAIFVVTKSVSDLMNALSLCWKGMTGIFIVMVMIALGVWLLARLTSGKHSGPQE